ncbi:hypothetical protein IFR05_002979 [Cadophora sp. M221]|nr:hypothetical protein IFR05_002979 [Cadophora sp. M221]
MGFVDALRTSPLGSTSTQNIVRLGANPGTSRARELPPANVDRPIDSKFSYKPLDFDTYEIRLLQLQWGSEIEGIQCALEHVSLIDPGPYIALSYCWGDPETTKLPYNGIVAAMHSLLSATAIHVDGVAFKATKNLISALREIRKLKRKTGNGEFTRLWVDAVCINQNDPQERSHQALETRDPADFREYAKFFSEPYWKRAWVIQEITVGTRVTVLYGDTEFLWDDIVAFLGLLKKSARAQQFPEFQYSNGLDHLLEFRERFFIKRTPINLVEALDLSRKALATDPRDKIFALLGLCHDGSTFVPVPNYRQPLESIIADMSKAMMRLNKSLDAICLRGISLNQSKAPVPTWAPNWQRIWMGGTTVHEEMLLKSQNVGSFNPVMEGSTGHLLKVRGTRVGAVTHLTSAMKPHSKDNSPLPLRTPWISQTSTLAAKIPELGSPSSDAKKFLFTLWKTLTMGIPSTGMSPWTSEMCFSTLWMPLGRGSIHDLNLIEWIDRNAFFKIGKWTLREWSQSGKLNYPSTRGWADSFLPTAITMREELITVDPEPFINMLRQVLGGGMRLACLDTRQYFIGMVHPDTQEGDKVFYLKGCTVPVVLRRTSDPDTNQYTVIGSAYLDDSQEWGGELADTLIEDLTLC